MIATVEPIASGGAEMYANNSPKLFINDGLLLRVNNFRPFTSTFLFEFVDQCYGFKKQTSIIMNSPLCVFPTGEFLENFRKFILKY